MKKRTEDAQRRSTRQNFQVSPEISYWSKKYNVSATKIEAMFAECDYSITRTIAMLQKESQAVSA